MEPVINVDDDDLNGFDDPEARPGWFARWKARLLRPLVPLANKAARMNYEVELARLTQALEAEKRKRRKADTEADAAKQKAETIAAMHAEILAMLAAQTAAHNAGAKRAKEV